MVQSLHRCARLWLNRKDFMKWNLKRLHGSIIVIWIIVIAFEGIVCNASVWLDQGSYESVSANKYYGSGIDWEGGNEYFVTNPADALIYFRQFDGNVRNMYLGLTRVSYAKNQYELLVSTIDMDGNTITFSHVLNYDDPRSFYVEFDQGDVQEVIINIKDMDESRIDDSTIAFNVKPPFLFSWISVVKWSMVLTMVLILFYLTMHSRKDHV